MRKDLCWRSEQQWNQEFVGHCSWMINKGFLPCLSQVKKYIESGSVVAFSHWFLIGIHRNCGRCSTKDYLLIHSVSACCLNKFLEHKHWSLYCSSTHCWEERWFLIGCWHPIFRCHLHLVRWDQLGFSSSLVNHSVHRKVDATDNAVSLSPTHTQLHLYESLWIVWIVFPSNDISETSCSSNF